MRTVCPWCQTEIVMDEELGPEEMCPHCLNELGDYRVVNVNVERDDDRDEEISAGGGIWNAGSVAWDDEEDDAGSVEDERLRRLRMALRPYTEAQEEAPECPECREFMVQAGTRDKEFAPYRAPGMDVPPVASPLEVLVFVCPSCFHVSERLTSSAKEALMKRHIGEM